MSTPVLPWRYLLSCKCHLYTHSLNWSLILGLVIFLNNMHAGNFYVRMQNSHAFCRTDALCKFKRYSTSNSQCVAFPCLTWDFYLSNLVSAKPLHDVSAPSSPALPRSVCCILSYGVLPAFWTMLFCTLSLPALLVCKTKRQCLRFGVESQEKLLQLKLRAAKAGVVGFSLNCLLCPSWQTKRDN